MLLPWKFLLKAFLSRVAGLSYASKLPLKLQNLSLEWLASPAFFKTFLWKKQGASNLKIFSPFFRDASRLPLFLSVLHSERSASTVSLLLL
jgi:hypothetical protein